MLKTKQEEGRNCLTFDTESLRTPDVKSLLEAYRAYLCKTIINNESGVRLKDLSVEVRRKSNISLCLHINI